MEKEGTPGGSTRSDLMTAAAEVFARTGFRKATVREICLRAKANIAAVNYHFGDKQALYQAVLEDSQRRSIEKYPPNLGLERDATPEARLEAFVHSFLLRMFSDGPAAHHAKLMTLEMMDPTPALDALVENGIRPLATQLAGIVREILGEGVGPERVRLCGLSVVGQCVYYHNCKAVTSRLFPEMRFSSGEIKRIARHITEFSLAGIKGFQTKGQG